MKRRTKTVGLRLTLKEWRAIQAHRRKEETISDTIRRLLTSAVSRVPSEGGK